MQRIGLLILAVLLTTASYGQMALKDSSGVLYWKRASGAYVRVGVTDAERLLLNAMLPAATYNTNRTTDQAATSAALTAANNAQTAANSKEPGLGNPSANGYILSSTTGGGRSWIPAPSGGGSATPLAANLTTTVGGSALDATQGKLLNDTKAPLDSPSLTGAPKAPTAATTVTGTQIASVDFVRNLIAGTPPDLYTDEGTGNTMIGDAVSGSPLRVNTNIVARKAYTDSLVALLVRNTAFNSFTVSNAANIGAKQNSVTLTTTGSGAATFNQSTGALNIPTPSGGGDATTRQTVTSGATSTVATAAGNIEYYIDPATTLTSHTVTLPSTLIDNQRITFHFGGTISSGVVVSNFSVVANSGQTIIQATTPGSVEAGEAISYIWNASNAKAFRSY